MLNLIIIIIICECSSLPITQLSPTTQLLSTIQLSPTTQLSSTIQLSSTTQLLSTTQLSSTIQLLSTTQLSSTIQLSSTTHKSSTLIPKLSTPIIYNVLNLEQTDSSISTSSFQNDMINLSIFIGCAIIFICFCICCKKKDGCSCELEKNII